jgi:hypothetical protein
MTKPIIFVKSYIKQLEFIDVVFNVSVDDEEKEFYVKVNHKDKCPVILKMAFDQIKKDIKEWINKLEATPSIVGTQFIYEDKDFE